MTENDAAGVSPRALTARRVLCATALGLAGLALNYLSVPILGEETPQFVFGGAPVLLAFAVLGPLYGTFAGLLSLWPMLSQANPAGYASLIYLIEFLGLYWLYPRVQGFVLASVAFWLTVGWLLDLMLYGWGVGLSRDYLTLLFFKQILNGAFNAVLADGLLAVAGPWLHARAGEPAKHPTPLRGLAVRLAMGMVLVPVLAGTISVAREAYAHSVTQAYDEANTIANSVAGSLRRHLVQRELEVTSLSRELDLARVSGTSEPGDALRLFLQRQPAFLNVEITDAAGTILASAPEVTATGTRLVGRSVATRSYFAEARNQRTLVWAPLILGALHVRDVSAAEPVLVAAAPLFDERGSFRGLLVAAVDVVHMLSSAVPGREQSSIRVTVLDSVRRVVYAEDHARRVGTELGVPVALTSGEDPEASRISYHPPKVQTTESVLGIDRLFAVVQPVRRGGLLVLVDVPASWVHARMRGVTGRTLFLFALFFGFAAFLAAWGTRAVTLRVVGWQTAVEDVAHGRFIAPGLLQRGLHSRVTEVRTLSGALAIMDEAVRSERKLAQATIASSEDRLHAIADHTIAVIFMKDLAGRYLFVNLQFEAVTGLTAAAILGKTDHDIFPQDRAEGFRRCDQEVIRTGRAIEVEEQLLLDDGVHVYLTTRFPLRTESGEIYAVGAIANDHTEHTLAAEETAALQAQNQQLQRSESLGRMAGAIAHHFNNQLGAVIGNLELALESLPPGAAPIENVSEAMTAAHRAADVSARMLTYLGQTSGVRTRLDLADVCARHVPMLRAVMPQNVVLETDMPSPGPVISADQNQIHQVLSNLITNAWEAIGELQGVIRLTVTTVSRAGIHSAYRVPLDWRPQDRSYACLTVEDNGCGIADADIEKLFDPFYSSKFAGRGLGLPAVLGILRSHGGAATVESEVGRGSTFRVFFPASEHDVARQPDVTEATVPPVTSVAVAASSAVRDATVGGTVLLVEDETAVRKMTAKMLRRLGYAVIEAKDGVEAVEVFREHQAQIRCVLSDLTMPRMSGWETLAALRALAPAIPMVLASGYDEASVMAGEHTTRPDAFLSKPFQLKGLGEAIEKAITAQPSPGI